MQHFCSVLLHKLAQYHCAMWAYGFLESTSFKSCFLWDFVIVKLFINQTRSSYTMKQFKMSLRHGNAYQRYITGVIGFGVFALLGLLLTALFAHRGQWFMVCLSVLLTYVALDNMFCGSRAKTCASGITTHYVIPWNIRARP